MNEDVSEIWLPVIEYENIYQVSNLGRVRSLDRIIKRNKQGACLHKGVVMKPSINHKGYEIIDLRDHGKRKGGFVHRLVAKAFIENPLNRPQVNHIDGNKRNNNVKNLEWVNNSENQIHAYKLGLNKHSDKAGRPKKKVAMIDPDSNKVLRRFESVKDAFDSTGIHNIGFVCNKKRPKAGGFKWEFI